MFEAITEAISGLLIGLMSGTVGFFIVMILAFVYRYFTLEKLSSFIGIVFGLGFLGFSGGLLAILEQPSLGGAIEIIVVVIFTVWGANIGDKIADKIPKRSGGTLIGLARRKETLLKVKLPAAEFILDMPTKKRISDSVKAELSEREFILPQDLPIEEVPQWIKQRLSTEWGIGDAVIDVDKEGKVTHFAVSAREEGLSSMLPKEKVALPIDCRIIPSGLVAGDVVRIIFSNGEVMEEAEVIGVSTSQSIVTVIASSEWIDRIRGNRADFLVALPYPKTFQKTISVRRKSGVIESFTAERIFNSLREKGVDEDAARKTVVNVEKRLLKVDGTISTGLIKSIVIEELEKTSPDEAKKLRVARLWRL
jgi:hypothetical protein